MLFRGCVLRIKHKIVDKLSERVYVSKVIPEPEPSFSIKDGDTSSAMQQEHSINLEESKDCINHSTSLRMSHLPAISPA